MDHGKFAALDSPDKLKDVLGGDIVSLEIEGDPAPLEEGFKSLAWVKTVKRHDDVFSLTMEHGERRIPELIQVAQRGGSSVSCVHLRKPSLEDVFLYYTGRTIRDVEAGRSERNRAVMMAHGRRLR
jgi:ABC-2 type transport system ATP-binding protein